jgi:hypothetical protein
VRWALLFHDSGKPAAEWTGPDGRKHYYAHIAEDRFGVKYETPNHETVSERLWRMAANRMNVPKAISKPVATIIKNHMVPTQTRSTSVRVRRMRVQFGDDLLRDCCCIACAI